MIDLSERQQLRQPSLDGKDVGTIVPKEGLTLRSDEQDATIGRKPTHHDVGAEPSHASCGPSFSGHEVNLGMMLVAADVGHKPAVAREHRR